jgi:hypothetical protein
VLFALAITGASAWAQEAQLSGVVADPSGAVVPAARVTALNQETGVKRNTAANRQGYYFLPALPPGVYRVQAQASGFQITVREGLKLTVDQNARLDFKLQLSRTQERVEVIEPAVALLNTSDATLGAALSTRQIEQLPIEGRNITELLSLQPGTLYLGENLTLDWRSGSVNGARADQANVTLDGVDVNDQNSGAPFNSVLRVTQDSVQELRVVTSNPTAQQGRSSGAQVTLVTKSGTNTLHGSLYEYNRNRLFTANDYFLKASQLASGQPNQPANLIRNVFGGTLGGPLRENRLFYFVNYEGRRDDEADSVVRIVPTASFRAGDIKYENSAGGVTTLNPQQILAMDPLNLGVNQNVLSILKTYPLPNDSTQGDGFNTAGYRFAATEHSKYDTYIARLDYVLTPDGRHTLFWRGNLQNDNAPAAPEFPGQPPASVSLNNSKGFAAGYTALLSLQTVNTLRWGVTRQGAENTGGLPAPLVQLGAVDAPYSFARDMSLHVPVNNITDDFSWNRGKHAIQIGANLRRVDDDSRDYSNAFSSGEMVDGFLQGSGIAGKGGPFDPAAAGFTPVAADFDKAYDNVLLTLVGIVTDANAIYNYNKNGTALPLGSPVLRQYRWTEQEYYAQDTWKIRPNLTFIYGLRWTLLQPPFEVNGTQVGPCTLSGSTCTPLSLTNWFNQSAQQGATGGAAINVPLISFAPNGPVNGKAGFWNWDYKDLGPRLGLAWSPDFGHGWLGKALGGKGKVTVRAGYSLVYDHFGAGVVNTYNANGSYGLTTQASNVPGAVTVASAPRFTSLTSVPTSLLPPAPAGGFPATPPADAFAITWGLDSSLKTPYSHDVDFAISRELGQEMVLTTAYSGRFGRRLPEQEDVAMPLDLVDPKTGVDYFTAVTMLSKLAYAGTNINSVQPIPYFQDLFGSLAGLTAGGSGPLTATQVVYNQVQRNLGNETAALFNLDLPNSQTGAGLNVPGHSYPSYRFYHDQYSSLFAWRTIGASNYNSLQVTLHKRFGHGLQGDFNYTWSKSLDLTSQVERAPSAGIVNFAQIINSWSPRQLWGVSDYDATHQVNGNWLAELPFGNGRRFFSGTNRWVDAAIGGWQLSGLLRWTSGLPFGVKLGSTWPTNWDIPGFATLDAPIPASALARGSGPQAFADPQAVLAAFRLDYPGESGTRNPLRGDGYYGLDAGLSKLFMAGDRLKVRLRWDAFNVTNSVRFDVRSLGGSVVMPINFGVYSSTLTSPRVMQVAARLEF